MSTIEPEVIEGGSKMEGNSICGVVRQVTARIKEEYQAFVLSQKDCDASVNFADRQRDQHV